MQFKSVVLSLAIFAAVFVSAAPTAENEAEYVAGGQGGAIGDAVSVSRPSADRSKVPGAQGNTGITANAPIENPDILKYVSVDFLHDFAIPFASDSEAKFGDSTKENGGEERRGDELNTDQ
jgi:hypothetical protein